MPSAEEFQQYEKMISNKYLSVSEVCATAGELKIYLEQAGDCVTQHVFFKD